MKKNFKYYAACWAVLTALYCVVVFAVRPVLGFTITYDARFWTAFISTLLALAGQLGCAAVAFKAENKEKLFLNLPLITESYVGAVAMTICGAACMLIPDCPAWITVIVCAIILAFSAVSALSAKAAAEKVYATEEKIKAQTSFIRDLTIQAEALMAQAKTPEIKAEVKKVYEAIRYSDPMGSEALADVELAIQKKFSELKEAVTAGDNAAIVAAAEEVCLLVGDREKKCKMLK